MTTITRAAVVDACSYFDTWLAFRVPFDRVPGAQAAVLHGDDVVLSTAHGVADTTTGAPLTDRHLFRIASHSKTFTATAVMQLVELGRLRLDDTVGQHLPELADSPVSAVTVRELLAHGGGVVRDGWDGDFWQLFRAFPDRDELLRIASDESAVLARNERFKYSNVGYSLLGIVVERTSGRSYADYVDEHIVDRLGLEDTGPEYAPARAAEYAGGHSALSYGTARIPLDHIDTGAMASATGFYSTARDVVRYASAHFVDDDRLVDGDSKRLLQRTEWSVTGTDTEYGLGFGVSTIGDRRVLGHGGGYPGHITRTFFDPVDRFAVSVLTNAIDGPALMYASAAVRLIDLAAGSEPGRRTTGGAPTDDPSDRADFDAFCGRFATLWGVYDVVALGGQLYQIDPTGPDPALAPGRLEVIDDTILRIADAPGYASPGERLIYERDDDGSIVSVRGGSGNSAVPLDVFRRALAGRTRVSVGDPIRP